MALIVPVAAASAAALTYATAGVLQHRAAREASPGQGLQLGLVARLATRPLWLAGIAADVAALALHALALSSGSLVLVQALLVSGLLFALPVSAVLEGRHHGRAEWLWAAVLVAGLAGFLVAAGPSTGHPVSDTDKLLLCTVAGLAGGVVLALVARFVRRHRAALLGAAAGVAYGVTAALMKEVLGQATGNHPLGVLRGWPLYAVVVVGGGALVVNQVAFQAGPLASSLPPLTIVDPVVAIVVGALVFDERVASSAPAVAAEVVTFAVMAAAAVALARRNPSDPVPRAAPAPVAGSGDRRRWPAPVTDSRGRHR